MSGINIDMTCGVCGTVYPLNTLHSCGGNRIIPSHIKYSPPSPAPQIGCICPPGANLTCENAMCPRKGFMVTP
jgi:hypothetical protein